MTNRYTITVPLTYNDGTKVEGRLIANFESKIISNYEGFTKYSAIGKWHRYTDNNIVYEIISDKSIDALRELAAWARKTFKQEAIFITTSVVNAILIDGE